MSLPVMEEALVSSFHLNILQLRYRRGLYSCEIDHHFGCVHPMHIQPYKETSIDDQFSESVCQYIFRKRIAYKVIPFPSKLPLQQH